MVYLVWSSKSFGHQFERAGHKEIRAKYANLEQAKTQGDHDFELGREPLRVEDAKGKVLHEWSKS